MTDMDKCDWWKELCEGDSCSIFICEISCIPWFLNFFLDGSSIFVSNLHAVSIVFEHFATIFLLRWQYILSTSKSNLECSVLSNTKWEVFFKNDLFFFVFFFNMLSKSRWQMWQFAMKKDCLSLAIQLCTVSRFSSSLSPYLSDSLLHGC